LEGGSKMINSLDANSDVKIAAKLYVQKADTSNLSPEDFFKFYKDVEAKMYNYEKEQDVSVWPC